MKKLICTIGLFAIVLSCCFGLIACNTDPCKEGHSWSAETGKCTVCATACEHTWNATTGACSVCKMACAHTAYGNDGKCTVCGQKHPNPCYLGHTWSATTGKCTVCNTGCNHSYQDGVCSICGLVCDHTTYGTDGKCTVCGKTHPNPCYLGHTWSAATGKCTVCETVCEHTWNATTGACSVCKMACAHSWNEGVCSTCGQVCIHVIYGTDGKCTVCGQPHPDPCYLGHTWSATTGKCTVCNAGCNHKYQDGVCSTCGMPCAHPAYNAAGKCTACGADKPVADNTEYYDEITSTLKLTKNYEGLSFLTDGIGKATLSAHTDGDTTRFVLAQGDTVVIRYHSVDTPESTGGVEKWGKAATHFVKTKLSAETEIVLEATGVPAVHDSYGERYLGYVWYRNPGEEDFKLLNLELVENGFSDNKGIDTDEYPYFSYFQQAKNFAKGYELRIWSKLPDPMYSEDPVEMTIEEFLDNPEAFYDIETEVGSKVVFYAYLTSLYVSDSGTYTFTAEQRDPETGKTYQIPIYAGYNSAPASQMKLGHMYHIVGTVQLHYGTYQISGLEYSTKYQRPTITYASQKNYFLTFNSDVKYFDQYSATLYSDLTVVSSALSKDGLTLTITATAFKNAKAGYAEEPTTFTIEVDVAAISAAITYEAGDKIHLQGYQLEDGVITVYDVSSIKKR